MRAGDLFTDRSDESSAYSQTLDAQRRYMNADEDTPAAKNILVYYGLGGIGKTTLSERLQAWVEGRLDLTDAWGQKPAVLVDAVCRIDLHRSQGRVDMVDAIVAIRRAFGRIKKRWPAFDLAFAAYWASTTSEDTPLPGAGTDNGELADGVTDTISDILSELGVPGAGIATRSIRKVVRAVRARAVRQGAFDAYEGFEELLRKCTEVATPDDPHPELLGEMASLLNSDLCDWDGAAPFVIVFIDTFERLSADPRRVDEATLNQIVWRMPNVLFVITGRNMLDWYDETRTNLFIAGHAVWPGLVPGTVEEPRQHLVGNLAFDDRMRIIARGCEIYQIEIDHTVMSELATASGGLPQYLDLALALAMNRKANGGAQITVAEVTGSLGDLVMRVLEDVPWDEQRALRAAALFPFFNVALVAAAANVDEGCALRAMSRPMINHRGSRAFPYSMHDAVRSAIRWSPHDVPNGWAAGDWRIAGELGLAAVEHLHRAAGVENDVPMSLESLGLAIRLVSDQELSIGPGSSVVYKDWVSQAIVYGPSIAALRGHLPTEAGTELGRGIIDFVMAKTTEVTVDEAVDLLTRVFKSDHPLRLPAGRHRGYTLRNASRFEDALTAFAELVDVAPSVINRHQLLLTLVTARRFQDGIDGLADLPEDRVKRILRACALVHGKFDDYLGPVMEAIAKLRASGRRSEALGDTATAYRWRAFMSGDIDLDLLHELEDEAEDSTHLYALRSIHLARLLMNPGASLLNREAQVRFESIDRSKNFGEIGWETMMARVALALYCGDDAALEDIAAVVNARSARRGRLWIPVECALDSYGYPVSTMQTQWLEPYEDVRDRWRTRWDNWLERSR
jgi:hypothetical protein